MLNSYDEQPMVFQIRASEARYRAIVDDLRELICRFTPDGTITFANTAFYDYFNLSPAQTANVAFWDIFDEEGSQKIKKCIVNINDKKRTGTVELLDVSSTSQTETRWQEWYGRLLISDHQTVEYQFIGRDTTRDRLAEQHRIELAVERERARILRDFLTDVSHDLRTPIASILLALSSAQFFVTQVTDQIDPNNGDIQQLSKLTRSMQANAKRLGMLLESMFDMMEYDTRHEFSFETADLNVVAEVIACAEAPVARAKSIEIVDEYDPHIGLLMLDVKEISRAIQNILDNAIKYSPVGSCVLLRTGRSGENAFIEIIDNGSGIAEDDLPHIFDRFFRSDPARRSDTGGNGLGLAITKKIVEAHQGTIEVDSVLNEGSVFRIFLPLIP